MQRKVIIIAVVILFAGLGIFFFANNNKSSKTAADNPATASAEDFIKNALTKAGTISCEYKDEKGRGYKTYVKNGKIRSDIVSDTAEQSGSVIVDEKKVYFWNNTMAYVMDLSTITENSQYSAMGSQREEMIKNADEYKKYCKAASLTDDFFVPPSNIKFKDFSAMMPSTSPSTAAGATSGSAPSQEQMQQYMQQYQNQDTSQ